MHMKFYLQILMSTFCGCCLFSVTLMSLIAFADGDLGIVLISIPMIGTGMLVFGIVGSLFWYLLYRHVMSKRFSQIKAHLLSVMLGASICGLPFSLLTQRDQIIIYSAKFLVFILPSALYSLLFLWAIFLRREQAFHKSKQQGPTAGTR